MASSTSPACDAPSGYVDNADDCDDLDASSYPEADEYCDGADNDCDGTTDENDAVDAPTWYLDWDSDGYGGSAYTYTGCTALSGYVEDSDDCDDSDAAINPAAEELCDGADNDCDGDTDENAATDAATWFLDADGDSYGEAGSTTTACAQPSGYSADSSDCDDGDAAVNPGADEVCDGVDNDCDGDTDEDSAIDATTWYRDADADGFGLSSSSATQCDAPSGYVDNDEDCDDLDAAISPTAEELCDGVDNDCDGDTDEDDASDASAWYLDGDGDSYGDPTGGTTACSQPTNYVADDTDCDDGDLTINPGAAESCDGADNDCDGDTDEDDAADASTWYPDFDGDGYGSASGSTTACSAPSGHVSSSSDCDDTDASVNPGASESCNGADDDCDGATDEGLTYSTWYQDADGDGYGEASTSTSDCSQPSGYAATDDDCDDGEASVNPGATELCNGVDDDCDGDTDEDDASDATTWYLDADGDGYGLDATTSQACDQPSGYAADSGDCDDGEANTYPDASELCDSADNDCDGDIDEDLTDSTWYLDADGDGYGDAASTTVDCGQPSGYVAGGSDTDCDDGDRAINPGASETCDGADNDCDGDTDEDDASDATTWYADVDGDGYGDASASTLSACDQPTGYVADASDCDDGDASTNPAASDVCGDLVDNDCNDSIDDGCGTVTEHCGTISTSETWSSTTMHYVTCDVYVQGSAYPTLTIDDGVLVQFASGAGLHVGYSSYGDIQAIGSSTGILFTSDQSSPAAGDWDGLWVGSYDQGSVFEGLTVEYGGGNGYGGAIIGTSSPQFSDSLFQYNENAGIYGSSTATPYFSSCEISNNEGSGYYAPTGGLGSSGGNSFSDNTVTDNDGYPVVILAEYVEELDDSTSYAGNAEDYVVLYGDYLARDTTVHALDVPYQVAGDIYIQGSAYPEVTIEDGAEFYFDFGTALYVGYSSYGTLFVEGTGAGVYMSANDAAPQAGDWDGLFLGYYDQGSELEGLWLEYGGGNGYGGVYLYYSEPEIADCVVSGALNHGLYGSSAFPDISDSSFTDNEDDGVYLNTASGLSTSGTPSFSGNTLTGNGGYALSVPADYLGEVADDNSISGNDEDYVRVLADTVTRDADWRALDVPYWVDSDIYIQGSAQPEVTIEDGASFYMDSGAYLLVGSGSYGGLTVEGGSSGVLMTSAQDSPAAGDWDGLYFGYYTVEAHTDIEGLTLQYGGGNGYGGIYIYYATVGFEDCVIEQNNDAGIYVSNGVAEISGSTIQDNTGSGVEVASTGALYESGGPQFTDNVVTGNGEYPVVAPADSIGQLDASSSYAGNGVDLVVIEGDTVANHATWQLLDADYLADGDIYVQNGTYQPVLEIEDGVTLFFEEGTSLYVGYSTYGSLSVPGTSASGVTFTSAETSPAAGDWNGLWFGTYCDDSLTVLENITVEYAGDNGYGNLFWYGCYGSISDSLVQHSSTWGIYRSSGTTPTITDVTYSDCASGDLY